jgi:glyoxylase-like metal-dependent hydrolase (beta-lactamase superfamily II)
MRDESTTTTGAIHTDLTIEGLWATRPAILPFALTSVVRAFLLQRRQGNLLIYSTGRLEDEAAQLGARGGVTRQYLNHWHEAMFGLAPPSLGAQLMHHEADAPSIIERGGRGLTFSERHLVDEDFEVIPIPGHTAGATAYLWHTGGHRLLFTGDTIYLHQGKWRVAVLESSDRAHYIESLELIRELDFDVLVPWVAGAEDPYLVPIEADERRARIDALLAWMRRGKST